MYKIYIYPLCIQYVRIQNTIVFPIILHSASVICVLGFFPMFVQVATNVEKLYKEFCIKCRTFSLFSENKNKITSWVIFGYFFILNCTWQCSLYKIFRIVEVPTVYSLFMIIHTCTVHQVDVSNYGSTKLTILRADRPQFLLCLDLVHRYMGCWKLGPLFSINHIYMCYLPAW